MRLSKRVKMICHKLNMGAHYRVIADIIRRAGRICEFNSLSSIFRNDSYSSCFSISVAARID